MVYPLMAGSGPMAQVCDALGIPVVSTDCLGHGPRDILDGGRYGALVPVDDATRLAQAIETALIAPPPAERIRQAADPYTSARSARAYAELLRLA